MGEAASRRFAQIAMRPRAVSEHRGEQTAVEPMALSLCVPNALVRWAFCLSIFAIPFTQLYLPGTAERIGVTRLVQVLLLAAVLSQPRVCLRFVPVALLWFLAYCAVRLVWGLWLSPELHADWWPSTWQWLQFSLPWVWVLFNVLQFPKMSRAGLWALIWGCSLCALLHIAGVGTVEVGKGDEGRSSVFGENANIIAATYAIALIALVGLGMLKKVGLSRRLLLVLLVSIVAAGLAKTGSRTGALIVVIGLLVLLFQARSFVPRAQRYVILSIIGAILIGVIYQMPTVLNRLENISSFDARQEARARMFPVLWEIFLRSPIYGSGPDQYQFELTRRAMPYLIEEQRTISAHNLALLLLVETGIFGFLLFSFGLAAALAAAWRARVKSCGLLPLAMILPLTIAAVVSSNPSSAPIFWLAIAYGLAGGRK